MRVGILGATGLVGQQYLALLRDHPWFELSYVAASQTRVGERLEDLTLAPPTPEAADCDLLFVCADVDELPFVEAGLRVVTHTSRLRSHPHVPVIIPEVNAHHLDVLPQQPWAGNIVAKPNCSLQSYLIPLAPLHRAFGLRKVRVTTLQSLSGGGATFLASADREHCFGLPGEEAKSETEPLKILGSVTREGIVPIDLPISTTCMRIPISYGHYACVSVEFEERPTRRQITEAWGDWEGLDLPTAPRRPVLLGEALDPMAITISSLKQCPVLQWRFTGLSHNLIRGAAGGGLLNAETWISHEMQSPPVQSQDRLPVS